MNKSKSSKIISPLIFNNINRSSENEFENAWEMEKTNKSLSTTNNKNSSLHVKLSKRDDTHETGKYVLVLFIKVNDIYISSRFELFLKKQTKVFIQIMILLANHF